MKTLLMSGFSWSHLLLRTNLFPSNSTQAFGWQLWSCVIRMCFGYLNSVFGFLLIPIYLARGTHPFRLTLCSLSGSTQSRWWSPFGLGIKVCQKNNNDSWPFHKDEGIGQTRELRLLAPWSFIVKKLDLYFLGVSGKSLMYPGSEKQKLPG